MLPLIQTPLYDRHLLHGFAHIHSLHTSVIGVKIVGAASGRYNSMALDDQGNLYVWGYDGCATNGTLPDWGVAWKARRVRGALEGKRVVAFDAGERMGKDKGCSVGLCWGQEGWGVRRRRGALEGKHAAAFNTKGH